MESVRPVNPVAGYVGGKKQLARRIIARIGEVEHALYAEPFVGMGGVFLRRPSRPKVEAINDASRDVATFFRILQRHYQAFLDMLKWQVTSRAEFQRLAAQDPDTLTDLERAARFLYLQRLSFGGKVASRSFGIDTNSPARFDVTRLVPLLEAVHERLAGVWVDCLPWQEFIRRWDRPGTLFYLDPPYWGTEHFYGRDLFGRDQFAELSAALQGLQGRFILSLNDVPEVRALFAWASIETVELSYQAGRRRAHEVGAGGGDLLNAEQILAALLAVEWKLIVPALAALGGVWLQSRLSRRQNFMGRMWDLRRESYAEFLARVSDLATLAAELGNMFDELKGTPVPVPVARLKDIDEFMGCEKELSQITTKGSLVWSPRFNDAARAWRDDWAALRRDAEPREKLRAFEEATSRHFDAMHAAARADLKL